MFSLLCAVWTRLIHAGSSLDNASLDVGGLIGKYWVHCLMSLLWMRPEGGGGVGVCLVVWLKVVSTPVRPVLRAPLAARMWTWGGPLLLRTTPRPSETRSAPSRTQEQRSSSPIYTRQAADTRAGTAEKDIHRSIEISKRDSACRSGDGNGDRGQASSETLALCSIKHFPLQIPNAFARDADQINSMKRRGNVISTLKKDRLINLTRQCHFWHSLVRVSE